MFNQEPKCFVKYLDKNRPDTAYMKISVALAQAKKDKDQHGCNFELIEAYIIHDDIPQVLRTIARFTDTEGLSLVKHDVEFELFLKSLNLDIPKSPCHEYLQLQNIKFLSKQ